MKVIAMNLATGVLKFIYLFIRLFPVKNKIVFISRQSNIPSDDIRLLVDEIRKQMPQMQVRVLAKTLDGGLKGKLNYCFHLLSQMYHISTSRMTILDGYCIPVSVLNHKKKNVIIQMWHASSALKQFGWQTVDKPAGSSRKTAMVMKMHRNYNYVLAPSKITGQAYCKAFNVSPEQIRYVGLPHFTQLAAAANPQKTAMILKYPQLRKKANLLYLPTFRKGRAIELDKLSEVIDFGAYNFIVRRHALSKISGSVPETIFDESFSTYDWIKIADAIITDYSSLAVEAAIAGKRLYFYTCDMELYKAETGLNIDFLKEPIEKYVYSDAAMLMEALKMPYDYKALDQFRDRYIEVAPERSIDDFITFIKEVG